MYRSVLQKTHAADAGGNVTRWLEIAEELAIKAGKTMESESSDLAVSKEPSRRSPSRPGTLSKSAKAVAQLRFAQKLGSPLAGKPFSHPRLEVAMPRRLFSEPPSGVTLKTARAKPATSTTDD